MGSLGRERLGVLVSASSKQAARRALLRFPEGAYHHRMKRPMLCRLGIHSWRTDRNDDGERYLTCVRCQTERDKITLVDHGWGRDGGHGSQ